jgi:hypothetical protein
MRTKPGASAQQDSSQLEGIPDRDAVQERAYYRYVERGRTDGQALDDWLVAETEIRQQTTGGADS